MAEFCTCGSLVINGHCTNKSCSNKPAGKSTATKARTSRQAGAAKKEPKSAKTRRASKVVTYNLYDIDNKEEDT